MPPDVITSCSWSPALIVELLKVIAWPLTVLLLAVRFRTPLVEGARKFFAKRSLTEVSAGATGISAKFEPDRQVAHSAETGTARTTALPQSMTLESIRKNHTDYETEFSRDLYTAITNHLSALNLAPDAAIELLAKDNSLLQAALRFYEINRIIFRSQYDFLTTLMTSGQAASMDVIGRHFKELQAREPMYAAWDVVKYLAFLIESRLIAETNGAYSITPFGASYLTFMRKNLQLVEALTKL